MTKFELEFRKFLHTQYELEEGDFWQLQQVLMEDIRIFGLSPEIACLEFFLRTSIERTDSSIPKYTETDTYRFVISWQMREARTRDFLRQQNLPEEWAPGIMMCDEKTFLATYDGTINTEEKLNATYEDMARSVYLNPACETILQHGEQIDLSRRLEITARSAFSEAAQRQYGNSNKSNSSLPEDSSEHEGADND